MLYLNHTKGGRGSSPNKGVGAAVVGEGWVDQIPPYQATSGGAAMTIQQKNSRKGAAKTNRTGSSWMERVLAWAPSLPGRGLAISSCPGGVAGVRHGALEKYGADTGPRRALPRCSAVLPHSQPQSP